MFKKARIKLTLWYLLIIMLISGLFSLTVYRVLIAELGRSIHFQSFRLLPPAVRDTPAGDNFEQNFFNEVREVIIFRLAAVNAIILLASGVASYFLADKTLNPIEEMVEEQKRFVVDASHELRTPLTSLTTEIEVGLRDKKLDLKQARQLLNSNLEEVEKIKSLSNYLLTLSRYENAQIPLNFEKVDVGESVKRAIEKVRPLAKRKGVTINTEISEVVIEANEMSLVELLIILLDNAVKYSRDNGKVLIKVEIGHRQVAISVKDFGVGIKPSEIPYIFNRFYRADSSREKLQVDGYGLGLAIAKSIVDLYKGKISVESTIGQGSTFTVKLPLKHQGVMI